MEEVVVASLEDLRCMVESMPDDVVITVPLGKEDTDGKEEHV